RVPSADGASPEEEMGPPSRDDPRQEAHEPGERLASARKWRGLVSRARPRKYRKEHNHARTQGRRFASDPRRTVSRARARGNEAHARFQVAAILDRLGQWRAERDLAGRGSRFGGTPRTLRP